MFANIQTIKARFCDACVALTEHVYMSIFQNACKVRSACSLLFLVYEGMHTWIADECSHASNTQEHWQSIFVADWHAQNLNTCRCERMQEIDAVCGAWMHAQIVLISIRATALGTHHDESNACTNCQVL
jgi:hypothetical protein